MQNRKRIFTLTISALVLLGFMATSLIGYFVARDSTSDQLQKQMLPLTSDNIYSEIQRDLLQPLLISSLMANDTFMINWAENGEQDPERLSEYLAQIQRKYNTITAFLFLKKHAIIIIPKALSNRLMSLNRLIAGISTRVKSTRITISISTGILQNPIA